MSYRVHVVDDMYLESSLWSTACFKFPKIFRHSPHHDYKFQAQNLQIRMQVSVSFDPKAERRWIQTLIRKLELVKQTRLTSAA